MTRRVVVLWAVAVVLVLLAGGLGALVDPGTGVGVGCFGLAVAFVATAASQRSVDRHLQRQTHRMGRLVSAANQSTVAPTHDADLVSRIEKRLEQLAMSGVRDHQLIAETHLQVHETSRQVARDSFRMRTSLDTLPTDIVRLSRTVDALTPGARRLPGLGDWAVTPSTLLSMLDEVYRRPAAVVVLECGSGSSTLFFALALRERGLGGRVVALESDAAFAEETRRHLQEHGVHELACVIDAPLVDVVLPGEVEPRLWFDLSGLPDDLPPVDILFVDGPVGGTSAQARYPAYPMLAERLAPGALVVLDDTDRPDETAILDLWKGLGTGERQLEASWRNVRSTSFRVIG